MSIKEKTTVLNIKPIEERYYGTKFYLYKSNIKKD